MSKPLQYTYDPTARAGYVIIGGGNIGETRELAENVLIDFNEDGSPHGIELLDAWTEDFVKRWADVIQLLAKGAE